MDIGCGFGGLTVSLASLFPDKPVVGFEIRDNKDIKDITKEVLRNLKFERILK